MEGGKEERNPSSLPSLGDLAGPGSFSNATVPHGSQLQRVTGSTEKGELIENSYRKSATYPQKQGVLQIIL